MIGVPPTPFFSEPTPAQLRDFRGGSQIGYPKAINLAPYSGPEKFGGLGR